MISKEQIELLIIDKLSNQISEEDNALLEKYINQDEEVRKLWEQSEEIVLRYKAQKHFEHLDEEMAWRKVMNKVSLNKTSVFNVLKYSRLVAASLLISFLLGMIWFMILKNKVAVKQANSYVAQITFADGSTLNLEKNNRINIGNLQFNAVSANKKVDPNKKRNRKNEILTIDIPKGKTYSLILDDSTIVRLNSESKLKFPLFFEGNTRHVELIGEAFFEVTRQQGKSFVVSTSNMDIKVLGTKFNVSSYSGSVHQISLLEGSVEVNDLHSGIIEKIKPGQAAIKTGLNKMKIEAFESENVLSWLKGVYYFNNMTLKDLVRLTNRVTIQDLKIENPKLVNYKFSGVLYANKPISVLLESLKTSSSVVNYRFRDGQVELF